MHEWPQYWNFIYRHQISLNHFSLIIESTMDSPLTGVIPNKVSHFSSQSNIVGPMTRCPSTWSSKWSDTSWKVMVHSLVGKWKMCVSGLHLSTNAVTKPWSTFRCLNLATPPNPASSIIGRIIGCGSGME